MAKLEGELLEWSKGAEQMLFDKLFKRKPSLTVEEFCQAFYDSYVFLQRGESRQVRQDLWDDILNSLMKAEDTPVDRDSILFAHELTAAQLEVFGLAWMHQFTSEEYHGQEEEYTFSEITFTKRYLEQYGFQDVWKAMGGFSEAIAAALLHPSIDTRDRVFTPLVSLGGVASTQRSSSDCHRKIAAGASREWAERIGSDCSNHLSKRMSSRDDWGERPIAMFLALALSRTLHWDIGLESEVFIGLEAIINRLYQDSRAAIKSVNVREPESGRTR